MLPFGPLSHLSDINTLGFGSNTNWNGIKETGLPGFSGQWPPMPIIPDPDDPINDPYDPVTGEPKKKKDSTIFNGFGIYVAQNIMDLGKTVLRKVKQGVIESVRVDNYMREAVFYYLYACGTQVFKDKVYDAVHRYEGVNKQCHQLYVYEMRGQSASYFILNGVPIWMDRYNSYMNFYFFRGTVNVKNFLRDAKDFWSEGKTKYSKHYNSYVKYHTGSVGKDESPNAGKVISSKQKRDPFPPKYLDGMPEDEEVISQLDNMAIYGDAVKMSDDISLFLRNAKWYKSKGVSWKRGFSLEGPPGSGKTSLTRALAEEHNLPVHVMDINTLSNEELRDCWADAAMSFPTIILVEDIDNVYNGRNNIVEDAASFDVFLNCVDGIERYDGIIFVVTTNHPEKLDPAILRAGRIDRRVKMEALDLEGRKKIAKRILSFSEEMQTVVVEEGKGDVGAAFQERCMRLALDYMQTQYNLDNIREDK